MFSFNYTSVYRVIRRLVSKTILLTGVADKLLSEREVTLLKFFSENGEKQVVGHLLAKEEIVLDVGGYVGYFTDKILKYKPLIFIFEPSPHYYIFLKNKYKKNMRVTVFPYGLSDKNEERFLHISGERSSYFEGQGELQKTRLVDILDFFKNQLHLKKVALISINIEGGEYELIDRIIKTGLIKKIKILQVQFHEIGKDYKNKRLDLINKILKTHKVKFSYPFVWEAFEIKKD